MADIELDLKHYELLSYWKYCYPSTAVIYIWIWSGLLQGSK